jgi:phosphoketolase
MAARRIVGNVYLEGTWSEVYPNVSQDEAGLKKLFKQFSFPGGISSHVAPTTPGSIHEGGELGYSLSHVVGDGEAETGPLATAWQSNKLLNPITDGAVLPILHLNGYKISNPTVHVAVGPAIGQPMDEPWVFDLMKLQSSSEHPHGLSETDYDSLFTKDKHIIFGFHRSGLQGRGHHHDRL